uniref:Uncharacterized protein n=1 Tax=Sphaerodactylus townsendi TaxID=933632 RepID=A0ACB8G5X0_9SAUR
MILDIQARQLLPRRSCLSLLRSQSYTTHREQDHTPKCASPALCHPCPRTLSKEKPDGERMPAALREGRQFRESPSVAGRELTPPRAQTRKGKLADEVALGGKRSAAAPRALPTLAAQRRPAKLPSSQLKRLAGKKGGRRQDIGPGQQPLHPADATAARSPQAEEPPPPGHSPGKAAAPHPKSNSSSREETSCSRRKAQSSCFSVRVLHV